MNRSVGPPPDLDVVLAALASAPRRAMVESLSVRPTTVSELAAHVGLTLPAIHRHVRVLEAARLVRRRKIGRTNLLTIERAGLRPVHDWVSGFAPWWGTDAESLAHVTPTPRRRTTPPQ